jgi:hypothetical protein
MDAAAQIGEVDPRLGQHFRGKSRSLARSGLVDPAASATVAVRTVSVPV